MHPVMDRTSPAHTSENGEIKKWNGIFSLGALKHSPNEYLGSERVKNLTPKVLSSEKIILNYMYNKVFK